MRRLSLAICVCLLNCSIIGGGEPPAGDPGARCSASKAVSGACFKLRGRLRAYDSAPPCRIWPVGSTHLLGVSPRFPLPANIACGSNFEVWADFTVCPINTYGAMQMVCVANAGNIRASERRDTN